MKYIKVGDLLAKESLMSSSLKLQFNLQYRGFFCPRCTHVLMYIPKIKPAMLPVFVVQSFSLLWKPQHDLR